MDTVTLSLEVLNSIFEYLGEKPYKEVHNLFKAVEQDALNHVPVTKTEDVKSKRNSV